ncbi:nucleoside 2-deoxyribosyltransferase [Candidatus Saccharibacteria bacterium]|nr:nucleoside 2-deoxyribosyltransferase [Candidatus Saccharibacteria bacterium]
MEKKKIYIAGPDVFAPDAVELGIKYKIICEKYGFIGLYPFDNEAITSREIYKANCKMIEEADIIVANLNSFRGQCVDDGTSLEIGLAKYQGKIIYGYMSDTRSLRSKIGEKDKDGNTVEDFGHPVNLMVFNSCDGIFQGDFEDCIKAISKQ